MRNPSAYFPAHLTQNSRSGRLSNGPFSVDLRSLLGHKLSDRTLIARP